MEPIFGIILFLTCCLLVSMVAKKKGRSAIAAFFISSAPAFPVMYIVAHAYGNNMDGKGFGMAFAAFLCPIAGLMWAIMTPSGKEKAAKEGQYGSYKKCPFCAEPIRNEAIKCKHCGSSIS